MRSIIISALEKATFFLANKYRDINLDAVLGFRVLQVHLKGALEKWASEHELLSQQVRVERLVKKLSSLIEKATHSLGQSDPEYFKKFEPILGRNFWMLPHSWNQTDSSLAYSMFDGISCFTEEMSDKCFTYLLGTWKDNGKSCVVTRACRNIMTKFGCSDYSLSHQLFYFMFADMMDVPLITQPWRSEYWGDSSTTTENANMLQMINLELPIHRAMIVVLDEFVYHGQRSPYYLRASVLQGAEHPQHPLNSVMLEYLHGPDEISIQAYFADWFDMLPML
ncbi:UPF0764 protein C16orf89 like protein [Chelonia mydas]|uniref:UPF0764 protein C16orf89 like protein n=1 Tax=Chelonia mydas TaxID=8469 RepID=M7AQH3_CHEMY|nr:UPF0764 protein C16orf89 like protein [Chelonia mydas]